MHHDCTTRFFTFLPQDVNATSLSRMSDITPNQSASQISFDASAITDSGTHHNFLSNINSGLLPSSPSTMDSNYKIKGKIYLVEEGDQFLLNRAKEYLHVIHKLALLILKSNRKVPLVFRIQTQAQSQFLLATLPRRSESN